jgi:hypothetical protein
MDLAHDQFIHVRIIIGIVTGLAVTRLLTQHPVRDRIYLVHLAWACFLPLRSCISGGSSSTCSVSVLVRDLLCGLVLLYWIASQFEVLE